MKYRALFVFLFGIVLSLMVVNTSFAGWPINYVSAIEGIITDATTGEPIENVIVEGKWKKLVASPPSSTYMTYRTELAVTDKNGHYKLHSKLSWHIFSTFSGIDITLRHPLYEAKYLPVSKEKLYDIQSSNGDLKNCDLKLLSLEEKYKNIDRTKLLIGAKIPWQIEQLSNEMSGNGGTYLFLAKKAGISMDYLEYLFEKWDEIISKYYPEEQEYLRNDIDKFKKYNNLK